VKSVNDRNGRNCTYHDFDEFIILGVADFADIEEEDGKLCEVNCVRHLREDSLKLYPEDLHEDVCEGTMEMRLITVSRR
jgi:hypothetical protein